MQRGEQTGVGPEGAAGLGAVADDASLVAEAGADDVVQDLGGIAAEIGHAAGGGSGRHTAAVALGGQVGILVGTVIQIDVHQVGEGDGADDLFLRLLAPLTSSHGAMVQMIPWFPLPVLLMAV